jgi:hypothetical protein
VPVIDNGIVEGDKTVLLNLTNAIGNVVLLNPSAAVLTVGETDGSLVLPAGSALLSESGPSMAPLIPASRCSCSSLCEMRQEPTRVTWSPPCGHQRGRNPSSAQTYSVTCAGPSVSRPFSFTAAGTNGQPLLASFQLQDGARNLGLAVFSFTLGKITSSFANPSQIVIRDNTNALPYPSIINVGGMGGVVSR